MTAKETADLLDKAIKELAKKKERAKQLAAEAKPDRERLESLLAKLEDHPQEERRQLLDAAGLGHISAAPKPIKPLSGAHARPLSHDAQRHATQGNAPEAETNCDISDKSIGEKIRERYSQLKKEHHPAKIKKLADEFNKSESTIKKHLYGPKAKKKP